LYPAADTKLYQGEHYQNERIKIAYLSADFHSHATVFLMLELFKNHDRSRFETIAISFGPDENSALKTELVASFDRFIDVRAMNDFDVARLLKEMRIDIAVDLKGYTTDCRPGILAHRPAPIQVNYLGYPGTMGAKYIDYLIGDKFVVPEDEEKFYTEKIVVMPGSYQVNGKNRTLDTSPLSREECGLPEHGFIFCSFNNTYKNNPDMFNVWMNLLRKVNGSVLWLLSRPGLFESNIRAEASARGISPDRIIFAENQPLPQHLARVALADLFLDSLPYSAHTTASDALWVNVPVVTCVGSSFAGRVGQSVLHAIEMPELVTGSLEEYESLAFELATDSNAMRAIREKLGVKIRESSLFDAKCFTRHLEAAYQEIWQRHQNGNKPARISVTDLIGIY
jgi:predicted O-linked N-acetylglucosamine transferase (SPINDLY family)